MTDPWLRHPLLFEREVEHGFGMRGAVAPPGTLRPRQVHGTRVVSAEACSGPNSPAADGITCATPGVRIAVVSADCVPILLTEGEGRAVAAVHAGWRGLAAGVVAAGVSALRELADGRSGLVAVIGPHIGPCCYEVDGPVMDALGGRFGGELDAALTPTRPDHAALDLGKITRSALVEAGVAADAVGALPDACTRCNPERFHSYRRDGAGAGRLVHFVSARGRQA